MLSLCMIARDEAQFLDQCLTSVNGLVDEIIVVDTGSTDDTIGVAATGVVLVTPAVSARARSTVMRFARVSTFVTYHGPPERPRPRRWPCV